MGTFDIMRRRKKRLWSGYQPEKQNFLNIAGAALDGLLLYPGDHLIVVAGWAQT